MPYQDLVHVQLQQRCTGACRSTLKCVEVGGSWWKWMELKDVVEVDKIGGSQSK